MLGNFKNGGTDYRPKGDPRRVNVHDFEDKKLGKVAAARRRACRRIACGWAWRLCYTDFMNREAAIAMLKAHETEFKQLGVEHLYLFGSTARGEGRADSDIDLFFDHPEGSLGLYELLDVKEAAARILGRKADIMTRRSLHPVLRAKIEASAQQIF